MARLIMGPGVVHDDFTRQLQSMRALRAKNNGGLGTALPSAGHFAERMGQTMYVYIGNSYGHTVYRVSSKPGEYLDPINNTGSAIFSVSPDRVVSKHPLRRADGGTLEEGGGDATLPKEMLARMKERRELITACVDVGTRRVALAKKFDKDVRSLLAKYIEKDEKLVAEFDKLEESGTDLGLFFGFTRPDVYDPYSIESELDSFIEPIESAPDEANNELSDAADDADREEQEEYEAEQEAEDEEEEEENEDG